jgi:nitrite reductase/ring-hydroxylating ferredoxin subunit/DMSO/TMAO reductase YedYZ heme-binding membrane subunit
MSVTYRAVGWNRAKRLYDLALACGVVAYLASFVVVGLLAHPSATIETLLIRALGTAAFLLLHVVLSIGPLCRLRPRLLPLLYNRRHLGVTMFLLALAHGAFATVQFHAQGDLPALVSLLAGDPGFQTLGLAALVILFFMAATSHDFWLANLTPPAWKALHMGVYAAYALLVLHVALGALRSEVSPVLAVLTGAGMVWLLGLHLAAGLRERPLDRERPEVPGGWIDAGPAAEIPDGRARIVCALGERIAVFRHGDRVSAVSNLCRHQNGPLGEGRILDGCITCPWHGYQYRPEDGRSPAPFTEKIATYAVRIDERGRVLVNARANPPGTPVPPALVPEAAGATHART